MDRETKLLDCRREFEAWYTQGEFDLARSENDVNNYELIMVQFSWDGWQAAWNRTQPDSQKDVESPYKDYTWEDIAMLVQENKTLKSTPPIALDSQLVEEIDKQLYLMRNAYSGNEVIAKRLLERCKAALQVASTQDKGEK